LKRANRQRSRALYFYFINFFIFIRATHISGCSSGSPAIASTTAASRGCKWQDLREAAEAKEGMGMQGK